MTELRINADFPSPWNDLDLPVEIRCLDRDVVLRTVTSDSIHLQPGRYLVTAYAPASHELKATVSISHDVTQELQLRPEERLESWLKKLGALNSDKLDELDIEELLNDISELDLIALAHPAAMTIRAISQKSHVDLESASSSIKLLSGNWFEGGLKVEPESAQDLKQAKIWGPVVDRDGAPRNAGPRFLCIYDEGQPKRTVALPASKESFCRVIVKRNKGDRELEVEIAMGKLQADLLLQFIEQGSVSHATTVMRSPRLEAQNLLFEKEQDPVAAMLSAYFILRYGPASDLSDWTSLLFNFRTWSADAALIYAEHCARQGQHEQALNVFLQMPERGLPIFTDGLSYAVDRLRQYVRVGFQDDRKEECSSLLEKLIVLSTYADFDCPLLTLVDFDLTGLGHDDR